ncbi:MAG: phosphoserine phosphatase [Natronomonas sp.]|jgi:phosphoserine phosphatase
MLIAFDFDGTLSDSEMTVLLGEEAGVADEIDEITERAMNDELSYAESLYARAELLDGLSEAKVESAFDRVQLRPGAADVIAALQEEGHHVAILTGGFDRGVAKALEAEGVSVDTIVANRLPMRNGKLTGGAEGPLIEGTKDDALDDLAEEVGVDMADTVAIGDGANDLPMLEVAGLAIGYEPKLAVEPHCDIVVDSMTDLLELLEAKGVLE